MADMRWTWNPVKVGSTRNLAYEPARCGEAADHRHHLEGVLEGHYLVGSVGLGSSLQHFRHPSDLLFQHVVEPALALSQLTNHQPRPPAVRRREVVDGQRAMGPDDGEVLARRGAR